MPFNSDVVLKTLKLNSVFQAIKEEQEINTNYPDPKVSNLVEKS